MFDVIVIGGGHAGTEAATASARFGTSTALITHRFDTIGTLSCNPAIGGLGKGHIVREIDALDGVMARVADKAGIQFRVLNKSKGPAVHGLRAQMDRDLYKQAMQGEIRDTSNLEVVEGAVADILFEGDSVTGVKLESGEEYIAKSIVLTTGTFLGGIIFRGDERTPSGRLGDKPSNQLANSLRALGLPMARLKTGTPARLAGHTMDWSKVEQQPADNEPTPFSFQTDRIVTPQISCGVAWTNEDCHDIIAKSLKTSAVYSGAIAGVGPRYCPSIEDKVHKFPDRTRHQIFLEPEGLDGKVIYPNGISTSLPAEVQSDFIRQIRGLEQVEILEYGYAIEYDYIDPRALRPSLELKSIKGLFFAGQINGTTGYEEAAGQGLVAGLNAARRTQGLSPLQIDRAQGYIGVMIDDLTTKGVSEPYRMFTSRAEYRLSLRADNADQRLTEIGYTFGSVSKKRYSAFKTKVDILKQVSTSFEKATMTPHKAKEFGWNINQDGQIRNASEYLRYADINLQNIVSVWPQLSQFPRWALEQHDIDAMYQGYTERQAKNIEAMRNQDKVKIPPHFQYRGISGLTNELADKLEKTRPETLGQASRIEGMTPSALHLLSALIKRQTKNSA